MPHTVDVCKHCGHDEGQHKSAFFGNRPCEIDKCPCTNYLYWRTERRPGW